MVPSIERHDEGTTGLPIDVRHALWAAPVHQAVNAALGPLMFATPAERSEQEAHNDLIEIIKMVAQLLETDSHFRQALPDLASWASSELPTQYAGAFEKAKRPDVQGHSETFRAVVYALALWMQRTTPVSSEQFLRRIREILDDSEETVTQLRWAMEATDRDFVPHLVVEAEQRARESFAFAQTLNRAADHLASLRDDSRLQPGAEALAAGDQGEEPDADIESLAFYVALAILLRERVTTGKFISRGGGQ